MLNLIIFVVMLIVALLFTVIVLDFVISLMLLVMSSSNDKDGNKAKSEEEEAINLHAEVVAEETHWARCHVAWSDDGAAEGYDFLSVAHAEPSTEDSQADSKRDAKEDILSIGQNYCADEDAN